MTNNTFYPFKLSEYGGAYSLLLTDLKWDAFEEAGFLGNGHDWNRLIENLCKDKQIDLIQALEFDSEADMFCVRSHNKEVLEKISEFVSEFYDDKDSLLNHISKYAQYG
ncbi:Imm51 family immunity protein [Microbulbifer sp. ANSA003]|uniref:Imm51 family immunity protein n=1 Tax=Microbulbifer sp. ANSA003 TaxID=3243360 RepID=UPI0040428FCD